MRTLLVLRALWCGIRGDGDRLAGRYARAERRIRQGIALLRRVGRCDVALRIRLLNSLGIVYKYQGRLADSGRAYRRALHLARELHPAHPLIPVLYHNVAGLEHSRGRYRFAEAIARRGLAIRTDALGTRHPDVARDLAALGAILDGAGRHDEAETMHRAALDIFEGRGRLERREAAYTLGNLAACLYSMGRSIEAGALARRAVRIQRRVLGPRHPDLLLSLANMAVIEARGVGLADAPAPTAEARGSDPPVGRDRSPGGIRGDTAPMEA